MKSWWRLFNRERLDHQIDSELQFHIEEMVRDYMEAGMAEAEARRTVTSQFGNVAIIREDVRAAWGWTWLERFGQDLRYAVRVLAHSPAFTLVAVLLLGLGIGTTSVIFTQLNAVFWDPLPVKAPNDLRAFSWTSPTLKYTGTFTYRTYREMRDTLPLNGLACAWHLRSSMAEWGPVAFQLVTGNYFQTLGVKPAIGRLIMPDDDQPGNPSTVESSAACFILPAGKSKHALSLIAVHSLV